MFFFLNSLIFFGNKIKYTCYQYTIKKIFKAFYFSFEFVIDYTAEKKVESGFYWREFSACCCFKSAIRCARSWILLRWSSICSKKGSFGQNFFKSVYSLRCLSRSITSSKRYDSSCDFIWWLLELARSFESRACHHSGSPSSSFPFDALARGFDWRKDQIKNWTFGLQHKTINLKSFATLVVSDWVYHFNSWTLLQISTIKNTAVNRKQMKRKWDFLLYYKLINFTRLFCWCCWWCCVFMHRHKVYHSQQKR